MQFWVDTFKGMSRFPLDRYHLVNHKVSMMTTCLYDGDFLVTKVTSQNMFNQKTYVKLSHSSVNALNLSWTKHSRSCV